MYRIEIRKGRSNKQPWYWVLLAMNGRVLAMSENYVRKPHTVCQRLADKLECVYTSPVGE